MALIMPIIDFKYSISTILNGILFYWLLLSQIIFSPSFSIVVGAGQPEVSIETWDVSDKKIITCSVRTTNNQPTKFMVHLICPLTQFSDTSCYTNCDQQCTSEMCAKLKFDRTFKGCIKIDNERTNFKYHYQVNKNFIPNSGNWQCQYQGIKSNKIYIHKSIITTTTTTTTKITTTKTTIKSKSGSMISHNQKSNMTNIRTQKDTSIPNEIHLNIRIVIGTVAGLTISFVLNTILIFLVCIYKKKLNKNGFRKSSPQSNILYNSANGHNDPSALETVSMITKSSSVAMGPNYHGQNSFNSGSKSNPIVGGGSNNSPAPPGHASIHSNGGSSIPKFPMNYYQPIVSGYGYINSCVGSPQQHHQQQNQQRTSLIASQHSSLNGETPDGVIVTGNGSQAGLGSMSQGDNSSVHTRTSEQIMLQDINGRVFICPLVPVYPSNVPTSQIQTTSSTETSPSLRKHETHRDFSPVKQYNTVGHSYNFNPDPRPLIINGLPFQNQVDLVQLPQRICSQPSFCDKSNEESGIDLDSTNGATQSRLTKVNNNNGNNYDTQRIRSNSSVNVPTNIPLASFHQQSHFQNSEGYQNNS